MPFAMKESPTHLKITVGATTTVVAAAKGDREYMLLQNDSDEAMYLGFGTAAVMNTGVRLNANGGSYEMSRALGNLRTSAVNAICTSGSKNLCGLED